ncbi:MAG: prepilin-type N-terminal cleavage/methylation domain-containing protein [Candidatus Omnitrophica bacterium]|nr:prepilin-type N-terminal cleavage/methylation domain-containing protein [Candidatus Omnitrophota bacterium]MDE2215168.1 prepilin-type N-terminal cleavage/methylation domain-containing protein [Candidatus Omnitrophota bacterium]MDE2232171.1 prepilin-type N-terminal cleavage/methylation domain-containing protein [Candidatus Omnitrophota bacterium]
MPARKGFTLIEIIVVIVIVAILAVIAIPSYENYMQLVAARAAQNNLVGIYNAQKLYYLNNNGAYCTASCTTMATINANLSLNITDSYFTYACSNTGGFQCTATNISDGTFTLVVKNNPIVLVGGAGCATTAGASCNPSCSPTTNPYCPS